MARDTTISPSAAEVRGMHAESGVIDVTRLRVALARLSRRLRRHALAGLTPTQLAALSTVEQSGPLRLGDLAAAEGIAPSTLTRMGARLEDLGQGARDAGTAARGGYRAAHPVAGDAHAGAASRARYRAARARGARRAGRAGSALQVSFLARGFL